jgi:hypothetical protein
MLAGVFLWSALGLAALLGTEVAGLPRELLWIEVLYNIDRECDGGSDHRRAEREDDGGAAVARGKTSGGVSGEFCLHIQVKGPAVCGSRCCHHKGV